MYHTAKDNSWCILISATKARKWAFKPDSYVLTARLGIPWKCMDNEFRGERSFRAELDVHFPEITTRETLQFSDSVPGLPSHRIDLQEYRRQSMLATRVLSWQLSSIYRMREI